MLFFRLLFTLISLLFFHGELILGCGSQKCKLEPDLFFPSESRIASRPMFCSLILASEKKCPRLRAHCATVYLLSSLACFLAFSIHLLRILSSSQVLELSRSCLTDCVWPAGGLEVCCEALWESVAVVELTSQYSFGLMYAACLVCSVFALGLGEAGLRHVSQ